MIVLEDLTERFFKLRSPEKNIQLEKECGYFYEIMSRINYKQFYSFDSKSMAILEVILNE